MPCTVIAMLVCLTQEEERDVEGIQLKEAAATGAQAGDGEVDGGGAYSEASPVVQVSKLSTSS